MLRSGSVGSKLGKDGFTINHPEIFQNHFLKHSISNDANQKPPFDYLALSWYEFRVKSIAHAFVGRGARSCGIWLRMNKPDMIQTGL